MFNNRKDPLVDSIKQVMQENETRRRVEAELNEELGIASKKALPFELQAEYDSVLAEAIKEALHPNQQVLDVHKPEENKLTKKDFEMLRAGKIDEAGRTLMPGAKPRRSGSIGTASDKAEAGRQRALKRAAGMVNKGFSHETAAKEHNVTVAELKKHMMKEEAEQTNEDYSGLRRHKFKGKTTYMTGPGTYDDKEETPLTHSQARKMNRTMKSAPDKVKAKLWKKFWGTGQMEEEAEQLDEVSLGKMMKVAKGRDKLYNKEGELKNPDDPRDQARDYRNQHTHLKISKKTREISGGKDFGWPNPLTRIKAKLTKNEEANKGLGAMAVPGNVKPHSQTMEEDKRWDEHKEKWVSKSKKKYPKNWSSANERGNSGPSDSDNPDKFRPGKMEENAPIYGGAKGSGELETGGGAKPSSLARKMLTKPVMSTSPVLSEKEQSVDASRRGKKVQAKFGGGGSDPSKKVRPAGEESVEQSRRGAGAKYMKESKRVRPTVPSDNILKGAEAGRENAGGKTPSWLTKAIKDKKNLEEQNNPYAIGMAAAMNSTGDKPPLEKSTIMKGHKIAKKIMTAEEVMEEILANMGEEAFNALMEAGAVSSDFGRGRTYGPVNPITGVGQGDNTGAIIKSPSATQVAQNLSAAGAPAAVTSAAYKVAAPNAVRPGVGTTEPAGPKPKLNLGIATGNYTTPKVNLGITKTEVPNAVRPGGGTTMPVKAPATGDTAIVQQKIASLKQARDVETKMASDRAAAAASVASAAKPGADGTDAIRDTKTAQSIADRGATAFVNATAARASNPGMPATTPKAPVAGLRLPTTAKPATGSSFASGVAQRSGEVRQDQIERGLSDYKAMAQKMGLKPTQANLDYNRQQIIRTLSGKADQFGGKAKGRYAYLRTGQGNIKEGEE